MATWVGRYAIVGGDVHEDGPRLAEQLRFGDEERVHLFVLADPADERSEAFCAEVAAAVADLFASETLSLTGGLLRALRQAHRNLAEWNDRSLREHRIAVGVTCIAVRGDQVTVAQTGPGIVYVETPDGVRRISTEGHPAAQPLGAGEPLDPLFTGVPLERTKILMLSGAAEEAAGSAQLAQALSGAPDRALAEVFRLTREVPDMTAVLIADAPAAATEGAPVEPAPVEIDLPDAAGGAAEPGTDREEPPAPAITSPAPWRHGGRRRRMPRLRRPRTAGATRGRGRWLIVGVLLLAAALAAGATWFVPALFENDPAAEVEEILAGAAALLDEAEGGDEAGAQRQTLQAALAELEQALALGTGDPRVPALQADVQQLLDEVNGVVEVTGLRRILQFAGSLTAPLSPVNLVLGGDWLWLLDGDRGRVFAIDPLGRSESLEVYRAGVRYGDAIAARPTVIAWDAGVGRLLLIDEERRLFELAAGPAPAPLPLRDAGELGSIDAIDVYEDNLYVLDTVRAEVWRYRPADGGFDTERTGLVGGTLPAPAGGDGAPHEGALRLVVDGDLHLLVGDSVRRFHLGRQLGPLLEGIDRPLNTPVGLARDPADGIFYVADRGNRRIVAGADDGAFLHQFVHPALLDVRALALSPDGVTLYILTGTSIEAFDPAAETAPEAEDAGEGAE